jgi:hypothetical protein
LAGASPFVVDGGFASTPAFAALLAALKPGRTVFIASAAGAAAGAALLAHWGEPHRPPHLEPAEPWVLPGLEAYRAQWERAL